ncbi:MAG: hypothetical protein ABWY07_11815 [Burkholderiales bacterium]
MENRPMNVYQMPELYGSTRRSLLACGLWLRLGFVGASAAAVGIIQLFGDEASPLSALALAAAGAALAVVGWRRAHAALSKDADVPATTAAAPSESGGVHTAASA